MSKFDRLSIQITHSVIGEVSICGLAKFQLELKTTPFIDLSSTLVDSNYLQDFPIIPAYVSGASEQNISLVNAPVFEIASLAAGSKLGDPIESNTECWPLWCCKQCWDIFQIESWFLVQKWKDSIITMPPPSQYSLSCNWKPQQSA